MYLHSDRYSWGLILSLLRLLKSAIISGTIWKSADEQIWRNSFSWVNSP